MFLLITTNVFSRVFLIAFGGGQGTAFTIDYNAKEYIITAKHVVDNIRQGDSVSISIFHDNAWKNIDVYVYYPDNPEIDIAVLVHDKQISPLLKCEPTMDKIVMGQDVYFLGFPYGLNMPVEINNKYPIPFVKKATLSAIVGSETTERILYLDGHNNPGFSGGPVVWENNDTTEFKICSVISGYRLHTREVEHKTGKTDLYYQENSGIIISYGIDHAIDVIIKNGI